LIYRLPEVSLIGTIDGAGASCRQTMFPVQPIICYGMTSDPFVTSY